LHSATCFSRRDPPRLPFRVRTTAEARGLRVPVRASGILAGDGRARAVHRLSMAGFRRQRSS